MTTPTTLDGLLVQWGDRLFYPGNRIGRSPPAVYSGAGLHDRARAIRARHAGARIAEHSERREAFNIMLSMPAGTSVSALKDAARSFARVELWNHRYVTVLHTHRANPHVHLAVRAEGKDGRRLNPRKADLRRWREVRSCASAASRLKPKRRSRAAAAGEPSGCGTARPATRDATAGRARASRRR